MWSKALLLLGLLALASVLAIATFSHHHQQLGPQYAVQDTDGNDLQAGMPYYIVSAIRGGAGGGLLVGRRESSTGQSQTTHTPIVQQSSYDTNMGTPVIFSPASLELLELKLPSTERETTRIVQESMDTNIRFLGIENRVWQVQERREQATSWWWLSSSRTSSVRYVTLRGKPGNPGESTVRNWFRIERISKAKGNPIYRIAYCPNVCESCHVVCGRVGITTESSKRWLSVSEHREFPVVFIRARNDE